MFNFMFPFNLFSCFVLISGFRLATQGNQLKNLRR